MAFTHHDPQRPWYRRKQGISWFARERHRQWVEYEKMKLYRQRYSRFR